jgi:PadR family transcriptional regulator PadR
MPRGRFLGEFEQLVLLAVARLGDEGYGVTIRREIEERTGHSVAIGPLYATLERLESKGWVASREGVSTPVRGGRARRHYRLEAAGVRALGEARRTHDAMWAGIDLRRRPRTSG